MHFSAHLAVKGDFHDVPLTLQMHNCRSSKQSDFAGKWTKYLEIPKKTGGWILEGLYRSRSSISVKAMY